MEETKTITLKKPIELDGRTFAKIDLCEPTAGQMEKAALGATGTAYNIILVSEVGQIPMAAARLLRKRDLEACVDYLRGFTNDAPTTGAQ